LTGSAPRLVRLFVALDLPAAVRTRLADWGLRQLGGVAGTRLLDAESMHVTLCFLGGRDAEEVEPIAQALRVAAATAPIPLTLATPLWLPRRRPRVAAVQLRDDEGARGAGVAALQSAIAAKLAQAGWYEPEARPFLAHITVARAGKGGLSRPPELTAPPAIRFTAETVSLYRSRTGPAGARYEPLATVWLEGRAR
jgi:RNA 2',3'-cyclic 3'-phosphodiesterase